MINRTILVGRLTKDVEYSVTPSGIGVAKFTLAVNRTFTNAQGERQADFINIVCFKKTAENVNNFLSKGKLAGVDGRIQTRSYDNQEGRKVYVTEVVADSVQFLEPKNSNQASPQQYQQQPPAQNPYANQQQQYQQNQQPQQQQQYQPQAPQQQYQQPTPPQQNPFSNNTGPIDISDEDLPF
ncbi:single-stranded DNA-binding protein [Macrococcoides goetzii]|uniref:Single-stranded DNA-binding protein n=1 Tax=Macrococcoides goetzii TaxID=1891097 RepID=A0A2G5NUP1_9STAP|nr:single-stranded DNA-binding protein [Macrococcus goetzii]RAI79697.1 single-stranded DNA-binding protein [Macrococcus goetzii]